MAGLRHSALSATIILWAAWALWHGPMFFYLYDATILPGFLLGLLAGAVTFTWLYNGSGGSVLLVAVWHGAFNFTTGCVECQNGATAAVLSTLVMVWAVVNDDLSSGVSFSQVPESLGRVAQRVTPVDDRCHFSGVVCSRAVPRSRPPRRQRTPRRPPGPRRTVCVNRGLERLSLS